MARGGQLLIGGTLLLAKVKSSITMSYQQLTRGQRYQLSVLRAQGMSILAPHAPLAFIAPPSTGTAAS
ncbi:hypothetical protein BHR42_23640 [Aeromonas salmonicida subsp. salmonicida]|nr:hypothetical protein BHR42_23640 [Aeromonas salmonicida subsp. salmonicida]